MLDIQIDKGRVDAFDPLSRPLEQFQSLQDMLQGVWKRFKCVTPGNFPEKLTFRAAQCDQQPRGMHLSGYYVCETIRTFTSEHKDHRFDYTTMRTKVLPEQRTIAVAEELATFLRTEAIDDK